MFLCFVSNAEVNLKREVAFARTAEPRRRRRRRSRRRKRRDTAKERSSGERRTIEQAKALLMERNGMSEEEAHRYLQKTSMENGTNMAETAEMVLTVMVR